MPGVARVATAPPARPCTRSSRAGRTTTCGWSRPARSPRPGAIGSRSAARSGRTRRRCTRWSTGRRPSSSGWRRQRPRHLLGIGEVDDLIAGVRSGIDTFDCAMPTRLGRHGVALVPDPGGRWRLDLQKRRWREADEPILDGCGCPTCRGGFTRAYLHYLLRAGELTGLRLVTLHNLSFIASVMADLRAGIEAGRLAEVADALSAGATPGPVAGAARPSPRTDVLLRVLVQQLLHLADRLVHVRSRRPSRSARWSWCPSRSGPPRRRSPPAPPARRGSPSAVAARAGAARVAPACVGWRRGTAAAGLRLTGTCLGA